MYTVNYKLIKASNVDVNVEIKGQVNNPFNHICVNFIPSDDFITEQLNNTINDILVFQGGEYNPIEDVVAYAAANNFILVKDGAKVNGPNLVSSVLSGENKIVTLTFDELIDKTGLAAALKTAITFSVNGGTTYSALGASDTVGTVDGTGKTIVITMNVAFTQESVYVKIAAEAIKNALEIANLEVVSSEFDVLAPVATFVPATGGTAIAIDAVPTITMNEPIFQTDGESIEDADLATLISLSETNAAGTDIDFTATISADKTVITVTPDADLDNAQLYYIDLAAVEDANGNTSSLQTATWTTIAGS